MILNETVTIVLREVVGSTIVIEYSTNLWRRDRYSRYLWRRDQYSTNRWSRNRYSRNRRGRNLYSMNHWRGDRYSTNCRRCDRYSTNCRRCNRYSTNCRRRNRYSRNRRRCNRYSTNHWRRNQSSTSLDTIDCPLPSCGRKRWSAPFGTQGIIGDTVDTQGVGHGIDIGYSTDGDAIDIQYCLTEGKRQINVIRTLEIKLASLSMTRTFTTGN